jgi:DNA-binding IclR family transcriptional regulator
MNRKRTDKDYQIDALAKGLAVLSAMEGTAFEPVNYAILMERTGYSRDFIYRALRTLKLAGFVQREGSRWVIGKRFVRLAQGVR